MQAVIIAADSTEKKPRLATKSTVAIMIGPDKAVISLMGGMQN